MDINYKFLLYIVADLLFYKYHLVIIKHDYNQMAIYFCTFDGFGLKNDLKCILPFVLSDLQNHIIYGPFHFMFLHGYCTFLYNPKLFLLFIIVPTMLVHPS